VIPALTTNMYQIVASNIKTRMPPGFAGFLLCEAISDNAIPANCKPLGGGNFASSHKRALEANHAIV